MSSTFEVSRPFDHFMKSLAHLNPHAFLQLLLPGATFSNEVPLNLKLVDFDVDVLLQMKWHGQEMLLHVEFQKRNDYKMDERMLRYNVLARLEHKLPVLSIVIYLFQDGNVPPSPLNWRVPTGQHILNFHFINLKLWEMSVEELESLNYVELLALTPLMKDGASRDPVQRMMTSLHKAGDASLAYIGYNLAALTFLRHGADSPDLNWITRSYNHMQEFFEESPIYQMTLNKGIEQGIERGIEQGLEQGLEQALEKARATLLTIVETRYTQSGLLQFARKILDEVESYDALQQLTVQISLATTPEEVRSVLLAYANGNNIQH